MQKPTTYPNRIDVDSNGAILWHTDTIEYGFRLGVKNELLIGRNGETCIAYFVIQDIVGVSYTYLSDKLYSWYEVLDYLKAKVEQSNDYLVIEACVRLISRINAKD
jgi:hypothetical protein